MKNYKLYGAILGDLAGQPYEFPAMKGPYTNVNLHNPNSHITDDTLLTLATANAILNNDNDYSFMYRIWGMAYQGDYYGRGFKAWLHSKKGTIVDSFGNGSIMRISPFMYCKDSLGDIFKSIQESHNHVISYESAYKLYLAYLGQYNKKVGEIKPFKKFQVRADHTLKFCLNVADQYDNIHDAIIKTIECGGDTDTNASIVGELMNFRHGGLTQADIDYVESKLDPYQLKILHKFNQL